MQGASHRTARGALRASERIKRTLLVLLSLLAGLPAHALAAEQRLKVLGSTTIEGRVTRTNGGRLRLEGVLADDAGRPVPGAQLQFRSESARPGAIEPCAVGESLRRAGSDLLLTTDALGRYCAQLDSELEGTPIRLRYEDPTGFLSSADLELTATPAARALDLLLSAPSDLPLDTPLHVFEIAALPRAEGGGEHSAEPGVWPAVRIDLVLEAPHRKQRSLGGVDVVPGERGRLEIPAAELGDPGAAVLTARFEGNEVWAPAETLRRVSKTARVQLDVDPAIRIHAGDRTVDLAVRARWSRGSVPTGAVEAFWGNERVGTGPISEGAGRVRLALTDGLLGALQTADEEAPGARLTLNYVPNAPWWIQGTPAEVDLFLAPPTPWSWLPWLAAGLGMTMWVLVIWRRPGRKTATAGTPHAPQPPGRASLDLLDTGGQSLAGQLLDAHTGDPVEGALIEALQPSLDELLVLVSTRTGGDGQFRLELEALWSPAVESAGPRIRVRAAGYAMLERPLPRRGRVVIHVSGLRRAILDRLISWARRKGTPWHGPLPPTPAHIVHTAERRADEATARWARQVEEAAFGPVSPDDEAERGLRDAEPP